MTRRRIRLLLLTAIVGASVFLYGVHFYSVGQSMIRQCEKIRVGQSVDETETLMKEYLDSENVVVNRGGSGSLPVVPNVEYESSLSFYTLSLMDDLQCNVFFSEGVVEHIEVISD